MRGRRPMRARRLGAALTAAVLTLPTVIAPSPAVAAPGRPPAARAEPPVPCPTAPAPQVSKPPRPSPPPDDSAQDAVGGPALATPGLVVPSGAPSPPALTATSWLVADLDTGQVLGGCGPHRYGTPASVQKLLLAATALPRLDPKQIVTVTQDDLKIEPGSSAVGLLLGGHYPVETLWLGLLLNSGNDAANALARVAGGDEGVPGTVRAMNEQARRLGALQTHAVTPSGLDGPGQFTSAYDLALIARVCFAQEAFRRYTLTPRAQMPAQPPKDKTGFQFQNENQLIFRYPGALGGKTGFTNLARHSYVGAAQRNGRRLVVTLLGAEARPLKGWQQGAALLDWGFALPRDASVGRLVDPGEATASAAPTPDRSRAASGEGGGPVARLADPVATWWTGRSGLIVVAVLLVVVALLLVILATRRRRRRHVGRRRAP